jgi:hypothetical protein
MILENPLVPPPRCPSARAIPTNSLGIMMIVMVFCSAPTSVIICIRRNSSPAGHCMIVSAACRNSVAASTSASALI